MMNAPVNAVALDEQAVMETALEIPLLDGTFCAEESRDCVMDLLIALRRYHSQRNLSHQERFGVSDPVSEAAVDGLARAMQSVRSWIDESVEGSAALVLESSLSLTFAEGSRSD